MDTGNNSLKIYDGVAWVSVAGAGGGGSTVVSATAPSQPTNGSMWYDTTNGLLKIYLAATVQWVPAQNNVFIQNTAPGSGFFEGDIWYSPLVNTFSMYIAGTTGAWVPMGSQLLSPISWHLVNGHIQKISSIGRQSAVCTCPHHCLYSAVVEDVCGHRLDRF